MTMRAAERLLALAESLCGPQSRRRVFEPLVADWQRQWPAVRGLERWRVLGSATIAFAYALVRSFTLHVAASNHPSIGFAATLLLFATTIPLLQLLPPIAWRHWAPLEPTVFWRWPTVDSLYFVPRGLSLGLELALLPAVMIGVIARWPFRRLAVACLLTVSAIVAIDGWVAPAAARAHQVQFWKRVGRDMPKTAVLAPTLTELIIRARNPDLPGHRSARTTLRAGAATLAATVSLSVVGLALAGARRAHALPLRLHVLCGWWLFGSVSFLLLFYWSSFFGEALRLAPGVTAWLPSVVLWLVGTSALIAGRRSRWREKAAP